MSEHLIPLDFRGSAVRAGLKPSGAPDLGLIVSSAPCSAAGVFTRNRFKGENIAVCKSALRHAAVRGLVVHAGQANACTGHDGRAIARRTAEAAEGAMDSAAHSFLVGSTGVIGVLPDFARIESGIRAAAAQGLSPAGILDVGRAMMTTDTRQKTASATFRARGRQARILGIAKGSGMIHPNMGTMLAYVMTDAAIPAPALEGVWREVVDETFNCVTVDGDTSTSDMAVVFANGASGIESGEGMERDQLRDGLREVCRELARAIASDGEGATRLVTVRVSGARDARDARRAGRAIATSNLVKTAIFGHDPNWGRIACALGYSGARFRPQRVRIAIGPVEVFRDGLALSHDRPAAIAYLRENHEVEITVALHAGEANAECWTCDFSYDYVRINAEYTT